MSEIEKLSIYLAAFSGLGTFVLAVYVAISNGNIKTLTDVIEKMENQFQEMKEQTKAFQSQVEEMKEQTKAFQEQVKEMEKQTTVLANQHLLESKIALPSLIPFFKVAGYTNNRQFESYGRTLVLKNIGQDAKEVNFQNMQQGRWNMSSINDADVPNGDDYTIEISPVTIPIIPATISIKITFQDDYLNIHQQVIFKDIEGIKPRISPPVLRIPSAFG